MASAYIRRGVLTVNNGVAAVCVPVADVTTVIYHQGMDGGRSQLFFNTPHTQALLYVVPPWLADKAAALIKEFVAKNACKEPFISFH